MFNICTERGIQERDCECERVRGLNESERLGELVSVRKRNTEKE